MCTVTFVKCSLLWLHKLCFLCAIVMVMSENAFGGSPFFDDDTTIHTEYVDRHNRTILAMFNLTEAQMSSLAADNNPKNKNATGQQRSNEYFNQIKESRLNDIFNRLAIAFKKNNSEENQDHPLHEMAAYPICSADSDESTWMRDNNVTIHFSNTLFEPKRDNLNLDSAILRLYKVKPNGTANDQPSEDSNTYAAENERDDDTHKLKRCVDPLLDAQIRVTVSIVQQLRRNKRSERKKRICNSIMMNVSKTGWVEIDIKRAIHIWEHVERTHQQQQQQHQQQHQHQQQGGSQQRLPILVGWLMIEVHDEEERPLKPGLYFKPPKCDEADLAIPWNYYRPDSSMSPFAANEVPRYPRLDVKLIGYASFAPKTYNKQLYDRLRDRLQRQFDHNPKPNSTGSSNEMDSESASMDSDTINTTATQQTADNTNNNNRHHHHHHVDQLLANDLSQHQQQQQQQQHNQRKRHSLLHELYNVEQNSDGDENVSAVQHFRTRRHRQHQRQQHENQQHQNHHHHRAHQHQQKHHRSHKTAQL